MPETCEQRHQRLDELNQRLQEADQGIIQPDEVDFALNPECWPQDVLTVRGILAFRNARTIIENAEELERAMPKIVQLMREASQADDGSNDNQDTSTGIPALDLFNNTTQDLKQMTDLISVVHPKAMAGDPEATEQFIALMRVKAQCVKFQGGTMGMSG